MIQIQSFVYEQTKDRETKCDWAKEKENENSLKTDLPDDAKLSGKTAEGCSTD